MKKGRVDQESILPDQSSKYIVTFEYLTKITNNFSNVLGRGGFGVVYKGVHHDGETIAVKRLESEQEVKCEQFENEVYHLIRLKHPNIVRFVGYCYEIRKIHTIYYGKDIFVDMPQMLLCMEYLPKGSLDKFLTDESRGLDWCKRYNIIKGICYGLHYLHAEWQANTPIIHMDLKPANILLDENMVPKIADFGLSRLFGEQQTRTRTINKAGTPGYMAPEYIIRGIITTKSDIFSLGVTIIEIITGHRDYPFDAGTSCQDFFKPVLENWRNRLEVASSCTSAESHYQQIGGCLEMCLSCLEDNPAKRPTTREIIDRLHRWESTTCHVNSEEMSPTALKDQSRANQRWRQASVEELLTKPPNIRPLLLQESQDALIEYVAKNIGYSSGKPTVAITIYKCLVRWRSFEVERTSIFDRLFQLIVSAAEVNDNNDILACLLSNLSTLLVLLQRTLRTTENARLRRWPPGASARKGIQTSPLSTAGKGNLQPVEAKYPALLFKQKLTAYVEKIYEMIRNNLRKEIAPLLDLCNQAPEIMRASLIKGSRSRANVLAQQALVGHWQSIVKILTNYLSVLKSNYAPSFLISKVFTQAYSFINVELFNGLLIRRDCCSFSNGEYVKSGLAEFEQWCIYGTEEYVGSSWEELKHIRQAVGFLVLHQKPKMTIHEITKDLCPVLSIKQLYRISTMYWDDKYGTHNVSSEVISSMRIMMTEYPNNAVSNDFLLDHDYSSIPFSVDDITKSMAEFEITDVEVPPSVRENPSFNFLHERND